MAEPTATSSTSFPDLVIGDFESADWAGWSATGPAFGSGPVRGAAQLFGMDVVAYHGNGVASSEPGGDGPVGTLTSPSFTIARHYIAFGVGGGDWEHVTCINLVVGGKVVRSATGRFSDTLLSQSWDVRPWFGKQAKIQLVDQATGDWGHVIVDRVIQTNHPDVLPVVTQPLYQETYRPQFHFTARQHTMDRLNPGGPGARQEGWINDLNGLVYYDGEWHLFAQRWNKCWIHAVSTDLVHWTELDPAFYEESLNTGVQSGTCVIDYANSSGLSPSGKTPPMVAFWSRDDNASQCISYSLDHGRNWTIYAGNPVLVAGERDPDVFWYAPDGHWVMMLYGFGEYRIFTSPNLLAWSDTGNTVPNSFECPDFFQLPLDGDPTAQKWVLVRGNGQYSVGSFDGLAFVEETAQFPSDGGPHFYATQSWGNTSTGDGRRIQSAWMRGGGYPNMPFNQQVTFPRQLTLRTTAAGPRLFRQPIREITKLHRSSTTYRNTSFASGQVWTVPNSSDLLHLQLKVVVPAGSTLTLNIFGVQLVLSHQSMGFFADTDQPLAGPLAIVEILVDRSSIEAFANQGEASVSRCFLPDTAQLTVTAAGQGCEVALLEVAELSSTWPAQVSPS